MSPGTILHAESAYPRLAREIITFVPFLLVGLAPRFSPFFMATP